MCFMQKKIWQSTIDLKIPSLESNRLLLRGITEKDLRAYSKIYADSDYMRFLGYGEEDGKPQDVENTWRTIAFILGHWAMRGYGTWAVVEKKSNKFIGGVGLFNLTNISQIELSWGISPKFWGKGYATEAALLALQFAFVEKKFPSAKALIYPKNHKSIKVARRLGFENRGRTVFYTGKMFDIFELDNTEVDLN